MKKLTGAAIFLLALMLPSCVDTGINVFNADYTIQVLGEDLVIPVGTTKPLSLSDLLKDSKVDADVDGNLFFQYGGEQSLTDKFLSFNQAATLQFGAAEKHLTYTLTQIPGTTAIQPQSSTYLTFAFEDQNLTFTAPLSHELSDYIEVLDKVLFEGGLIGAQLKIMTCCGLPATQDIDFHLDFAFSDFFIFDDPRIDADNHLKLDGKVSCNPLKPFALDKKLNLVGFNFDGHKPGNEITENVVMRGTVGIETATLTPSQIANLTAGDFTAVLITTSDAITLRTASGTLSYEMPSPVKTQINLPELPDILKGDDVVLDLHDQALNLEVTSNVTVPVRSTLTITPQYGSTPDPSKAVTFILDLPEALFTDKDTTHVVGLCLCDPDSKYASTSSATVIYPESGSLRALMQRIPDSVEITCNAGIIKADAEGTRLTHIMDLKQKPHIDIAYNFVLPFSVGSEFRAVLSTDMEISQNSDFNLVDILSSNEIALIGEAHSTIPLDMTLTVTPLDGSKQEITTFGSVAAQTIKAYSPSDGEYTTTELDLRLGGSGFGAGASSISAMRVRFTFAHPQTEGAAVLNKDAYVSASLALMLPQGLVIKSKNQEK